MTTSLRPARVTSDYAAHAASCLTDRDRQIALDCYEHGVLTTDQIRRLHFTRQRTALGRLDRLYELRVLDRFRPTLPPGLGTAPFHWTLDEIGARTAATELHVDRSDLPWRRAASLGLARSATLAHRVAVNEFFVRLALEARGAGGALREWYGERTTQRLLGGIAAPDGYGVLVLPERAPLHLLLELDRGTEPLRRIRDKAGRYAKALPRSELADDNPLVFFAAPSQRRAAGISRAVEASGGRLRTDVAVWTPSHSESALNVAVPQPTA